MKLIVCVCNALAGLVLEGIVLGLFMNTKEIKAEINQLV